MWLAVEGIIGAGKTTSTGLICEVSGYLALLEPSERHPFLEDYYEDPARFVLETELVFMALQRNQVQKSDPWENWVSDYSPGKNLAFASLVASDQDLEVLKRVSADLWHGLPQPDLVVFLDVPTAVCLERIARRARPYERNIAASYLDDLRFAYDSLLESLGSRVRIMQLDGSESPEQVAKAVLKHALRQS
jgi:deoxyadenosine/deoxycytidine kinase